MFAIGDDEWPGLSKLSEECAEVGQVVGKLMGTHGAVEHWDGTNLKTRLEEEIADARAAMAFVVGRCGLDLPAIDHRTSRKLLQFNQWHDEQQERSRRRAYVVRLGYRDVPLDVPPEWDADARRVLHSLHAGDWSGAWRFAWAAVGQRVWEARRDV